MLLAAKARFTHTAQAVEDSPEDTKLAWEPQLSSPTLASDVLKNLRTPFMTTHLNDSGSKHQAGGGEIQQ